VDMVKYNAASNKVKRKMDINSDFSIYYVRKQAPRTSVGNVIQ